MISAGFSAAPAGYNAGQQQILANDAAEMKNQATRRTAQESEFAQMDFGRGFQNLLATLPGGQPMAQAPNPGQASVPSAPSPQPGAPFPGAAPMPGASSDQLNPRPSSMDNAQWPVGLQGAPQQAVPQPGRALPQGGGGQLPEMPEVSIATLAHHIIQANPGIQNDPARLVRAMTLGQGVLEPAGKIALARIQQETQAAHDASREKTTGMLVGQRNGATNARSQADIDQRLFDEFEQKYPDASLEQKSAFARSLKSGGGRGAASLNPMAAFVQETVDRTGKPPTAAEMQQFKLKGSPSEVAAARKENTDSLRKADLADQLDGVIEAAQAQLEGGPSVTGFGGTVRRIGEGLGGSLGLTNETAASDFETRVRTIQSLAPRVLAGTKITNKDDRARIDKIVRGTEPLTSPQMVISAAMLLKRVLGEAETPSAAKPASRSEPRGTPGVTTPTAQGTLVLQPLPTDIAQEARDAIQKGKSPQGVKAKLEKMGYDASGL